MSASFTCANCGQVHQTDQVMLAPSTYVLVDHDANHSKFWIGWTIDGMCAVHATQYGRWDRSSPIAVKQGAGGFHKGGAQGLFKRMQQKEQKGYQRSDHAASSAASYHAVPADASDVLERLTHLGLVAGQVNDTTTGPLYELETRVRDLQEQVAKNGGVLDLGGYGIRALLEEEIETLNHQLAGMATMLSSMSTPKESVDS